MRTLHRFYAWLFGYFWLPCPCCAEPFGGHEATGASIPNPAKGPGAGRLVCPRCAEAFARARWMHFVYAHNCTCGACRPR